MREEMVMWTRSIVPAVAAACVVSAVGCDDEKREAARDAGGEVDDAGLDVDAATSDGADAQTELDSGDGLQRVTIRFQAKIGDRALTCGEHYPDQGTSRVTATPLDFRFYVQDLRLTAADGTEARVEFDDSPPFQNRDVALIDFTDGEGECGSGGSIVHTTITGTVAPGTYDGVVFVNGVPEELNHAAPAETAGAPLDDVTLFWGWLGGYRFIVAELGAVTADAGVDASVNDAGHEDAGHDGGAPHGDGGTSHGGSGAAAVHIGSTGCSGNQSAGFSCSRQARNEIRLTGFDPERNAIIADLGKVFETSDLLQPPVCHGVAPQCAAPYAAFGIDLDTGEPLETQQVFRVE
jgi:uncharacterized repeat protein (TIGR04052 family)